MSCCLCEPTETAQSLGEDTHAAVKRPKRAVKVWPFCMSGFTKKSTDRCSDKDAGKHERKTPTPCGRTGKENEKEKGKEERGGERQRETDRATKKKKGERV